MAELDLDELERLARSGDESDVWDVYEHVPALIKRVKELEARHDLPRSIATLPLPSITPDQADYLRAIHAHKQMSDAMVSACNCETKTHVISYHSETCRYRILSELGELIMHQRDRLNEKDALLISLRAENERLRAAQAASANLIRDLVRETQYLPHETRDDGQILFVVRRLLGAGSQQAYLDEAARAALHQDETKNGET